MEERKKLAAQYTEYSRPPPGGGPSKASAIAKEIIAAKKSYCEQESTKSLAYCKPPSTMPTSPPAAHRRLPGCSRGAATRRPARHRRSKFEIRSKTTNCI